MTTAPTPMTLSDALREANLSTSPETLLDAVNALYTGIMNIEIGTQPDLPTDPGGLPAGSWWNNGGVICVA